MLSTALIRSPITDPVAFQLGALSVHWYGIILASGVLAGVTVAARAARSRGLSEHAIQDSALWMIIGGIIGARLYYVIFYQDAFDTWLDILAVWNGGLAIHGGIIGGCAAFLLYAYRSALRPLWAYLDCITLGLILGQIIGRWGNFVNQEAFGTPSTLPWAVLIDPLHRPAAFAAFESFHPTFLYESLWNALTLFVLIMHGRRSSASPGSTVALYLVFYGAGRFFIEMLRTDSLMLGSLRVAQIMSLLLVIIGCGLYVNRQMARTANQNS